MESYEDLLNRMFSGWTDEEVRLMMEMARESSNRDKRPYLVTWDSIWREYAKRTFSDNIVCKRCGSENHTAENHSRA